MKSQIILLSIVSLLGIACQEEPSIQLVPDVTFQIFEGYDTHDGSEQPTLRIVIETIDQFNCYNYQIRTETDYQDGRLVYDMQDVTIGDVCLTALGPAFFRQKIQEDISELILINGDYRDIYTIDITPETVSIIAVNAKISTPKYVRYNRYPENSFACVCGTTEDESELCADFRGQLAQLPGIHSFEFQAGIIPYPDSSSGHWIDTPSTFYTYDNPDDFLESAQLLEFFTDEQIPPNSGISISLINWENQSFNSWQLGN